jgi:hypothetical protein
MPMLKLLQHVFPAAGTSWLSLQDHAVLPATIEVCNIRSSKIPASCQLVVLPFHSGDSTAGGSTADVEVEVNSRSRSAWRYRMQRRALAPVAAQLAAPVALGLLIGGVLAYQAGSTNNAVQPVPLGAVATPTPSFGKPSASHGAVPLPTGGWIKPPAATTTPATTTTTNGNCGITVPANPVSARRLATLYQLTGGTTPAESCK